MTHPGTASRTFAAAFLALLCVIFVLICSGGDDHQYLNGDEVNHLELAQGGSMAEVVDYSRFETHPPLGHILRHFWPGSVHGLSLVFGIGLILMLYALGSRIAGPWAGISCAVLAAFSNAVIIQSFVIRNYTIFLFFLTAGFYAYSRWRENRSPAWLLGYAIFSILALLTHFSALFALLAIAATESLLLLRCRKPLALWIIVNLMLGAIGLGLLYAWWPLMAHTHREANTDIGMANLPYALLYTVHLIDYFFVYRDNAVYALILCLLVLLAHGVAARRVPAAKPYVALALVATLLCIAVQLTEIYSTAGCRRSIWLLPFLLLPVGCLIGVACGKLAARFSPVIPASLLLIAGYFSYSSAARYGDVNEYPFAQTQWRDLTQYLSTLGKDTVVVSSRSDAFLLSYPRARNIYATLSSLPPSQKTLTIDPPLGLLMPYYDTRFLFRPFYFSYSAKDAAAMVAEAEAKGQLKGVDQLAFTSTQWVREAMLPLMLCPALGKKLVTFPPLSEAQLSDPAALKAVPAIVLLAPKQTFLEETAPGGNAAACLKANP